MLPQHRSIKGSSHAAVICLLPFHSDPSAINFCRWLIHLLPTSTGDLIPWSPRGSTLLHDADVFTLAVVTGCCSPSLVGCPCCAPASCSLPVLLTRQLKPLCPRSLLVATDF
ncbi:hypothetical protein B296_00033411 [Ensete ventricosum]|uniref:Uncharacterized protein n=1 Tax=Ensete ventricosum TaxID=4639 RepID=A0A427A9D4_ENSVE|nr:hypothetical protein B296_00033411 [Ensete ventricosum]